MNSQVKGGLPKAKNPSHGYKSEHSGHDESEAVLRLQP